MLTGQKGVKYGLEVRVPSGAKPAAKAALAKKPSVFGDNESDDDQEHDVEKQIARQAARKQSDKKVAELHAAALAEDAAIFDYDSHYDAIQEARAEPKKQEKLQRKSRYIAGLLEKAEERKREQDILYERQLAKERAAEDHLFGDREKFVTAAYRAKLAERQTWLAEQKRKQEEEEANAVEKRGHMGDFYRNLLRSNVAFGAKREEPKEQPGAAEAAAPAGHSAEEGLQRRSQPGAAQLEMEEALAGEAAAQRGAASPPAAATAGARRRQEQPAGAQGDEAAARGANTAPAAPAAPADGRADGVDGAAAEEQQAAQAGGQRRNAQDAVAAARERYLARKRQKLGAG